MDDVWGPETLILVPGTPLAFKSYRYSNRYGFFRRYNPMQKEKDELQRLLKHQWPKNAIQGPLLLFLEVRVPIPPSYPKKRKAALENTPCPQKPDCDNISKFFLDAMASIIYTDDKQVVDLHITKIYSSNPSVTIHVQELLDTQTPKLVNI